MGGGGEKKISKNEVNGTNLNISGKMKSFKDSNGSAGSNFGASCNLK